MLVKRCVADNCGVAFSPGVQLSSLANLAMADAGERPELAPTDLKPNVANTLAGMQVLQSNNALLRVNEIADSCFRVCVDDFGFTKKLGSGELQCLQTCVEKYLLLSQGSGSAFAAALQGSS